MDHVLALQALEFDAKESPIPSGSACSTISIAACGNTKANNL